MSVQSQVDRIDGNVKKALAKIAEKGVSVPDDANSDDLEALIAAIEAGGGSGGGGNAGTLETCTVTINMTRTSSGAVKYFKKENVMIIHTDSAGNFVSSNDITLTGNMIGGVMSDAFTIDIICCCGTLLTFTTGAGAPISSYSVSEEITQVFRMENAHNYSMSILTPDKPGNYVLDCGY
jgi:hypothetical protein